jgi:hypothetical protein
VSASRTLRNKAGLSGRPSPAIARMKRRVKRAFNMGAPFPHNHHQQAERARVKLAWAQALQR